MQLVEKMSLIFFFRESYIKTETGFGIVKRGFFEEIGSA